MTRRPHHRPCSLTALRIVHGGRSTDRAGPRAHHHLRLLRPSDPLLMRLERALAPIARWFRRN